MSDYTIQQLLADLNELQVGASYKYVKLQGGSVPANECIFRGVDILNHTVSYSRATTPNDVDMISASMFDVVARALLVGDPCNLDVVLQGGGNNRSVFEALLANTRHVFACLKNRRKHIVFIPTKEHRVGDITVLTGAELNALDNTRTRAISHLPRQLITYGAPGSGKSWSVKKWTKGEDTIRTTFHPDSDYSTFVGSYKPSMQSYEAKKINRHLTLDQLASILKSEYDLAGEGSDKGKALAVDLFAEEYYEYLDGEFGKVSLMELVNKAGLTKGYTVGLRDSINVAKHHALQRRGEKKIVYKFIPQSFIKAYVDAWKYKAAANGGEATRKYLVIEEINRGNCAQIFGDLFQLLDRNDEGFSDYEIAADDDLQNYLAEQFADLAKQNETAPSNLGVDAKLAKRILSGAVMLLPENLYIWATMNTSDQSLFPIDSAFKRRWEWKYMPIYDAQKDYKIVVDGDAYKWWDFLEKANALVQEFTDSEDKKLGYFFCKADASNTIPLEQFVGKVIFYLWNDVFKDAGFDHAAFDGDNGERLLFKTFFNPNGSPKAATVKRLMQNLGVASTTANVSATPTA